MKTKRNAFTLVELLVVTAILAILASLLLPALSKAKSKAATADCLGRLRQWGVAISLYVDSNTDVFPREDAVDGFNQWEVTREETNRNVWYNCVPAEMQV